MRPLIDGDILLHEIGWSGEFKDKTDGSPVLLPWESVRELLDNKIRIICHETRADQDPIIFLSSNQWLIDSINRERRLFDEPLEFVENFRFKRATTVPYKGTRKQTKPVHFYNIMSSLRSTYETIISSDGYEADDEMGIYQMEAIKNGKEETIICSRDKDLRMVGGYHYSWECGKQRAIGPVHTDRVGRLELTKSGKLLGYGILFFYSQLLTGDSVDNIPGLKGCGPVRAYGILKDCVTERDAFERVKTEYKKAFPKGDSLEYFLEQADLLWIAQERGKKYELPT